MVLLELFSGIGGFAKGFEQAGYKFTKHYFSEIDKHAIANYKFNFPNAESLGSVTDISGSQIERPDIITFGFPCQDLSIAGKRKGFTGKRSSLFYEAMRIINEVKPDIFIFENVKGLYSSHGGKDFTAVLQTIADIGLYECEWQLCNTRWVLPQNRERIFFVGHLAGRSTPKVFPITENDFISTETNRAKQPQSQTQHSNTLRGKTMRADDTYILQDRRATNEIREYQDSSPTISSTWGMGGGNVPYVVQCNDSKESNEAQPYQQNRVYDANGQMPALNSFSGRVGVRKEDSIRRLTEIECERLQGFPDEWTKFGNYDGEIKEITKGHRYRMLGNAVTVNIVELIAQRLSKDLLSSKLKIKILKSDLT